MKQKSTYDIILLTTGDAKSEIELSGLPQAEIAEIDEIRELREMVAEVLEPPQVSFTIT